MHLSHSLLRVAVLTSLSLTAHVGAQTPKVWYPFDGSITDETGTTGASISGSPGYGTDRQGGANSSYIMDGATDYVTLTSATANNSAQDLGMKGNFTAMAWMRPVDPDTDDNMIFGINGGDAGSIHYGIRSNTGGKPHMGMFGNDVQGSFIFQPNNWYHVAYQYDGSSQIIYVNGIENVVRGATNTTKDANLIIGYGINLARLFNGQLDDVLIYDEAISKAAILDAMTSTDPIRQLPGDPLSGNLGAAGMWGVREISAHSSIPTVDTLENAIAIAHNQSGGTITNGMRSVINLTDPQSAANPGHFTGDQAFVSNTAAADDDFVLIAQAFVEIDVEDDYTFGFRGDDGSRLRIYGQDFTSAVTVAGPNRIDPPNIGDAIVFTEPTGNGTVLGVVHLAPGVYFIEHVFFERAGGAYTEAFAAPGAKTAFDSSFDLIGDTATGGLEVVAPRPIIKYFETNADTVTAGSPGTITLSWDVLFDTSLSISGIGSVTGESTTFSSPSSTTTYTLSAMLGGETVTADVTIYVDPAPVVNSFTADDTTVALGAPVVLSWNTIGGTSFTINPGSINVTANTTGGIGSVTVNPTANTDYVLSVTGPNGSTNSSPLSIEVGPAPVISSFTVDDTSPASGAVSKLEWAASDFVSLTIDNNIGDVSSTTHAFVCPEGLVTYTLTAVNEFGTTTAQVTISAPTTIGIDSDGYTVRFVSSSTAITNFATADALLGGANIVNDETETNITSINYVNSGTAGELAGDASFPPSFNDGDNFALRATATLIVNVGDTYTFGINNDDGGRLRIDGALVILDDALHGPTTTLGSIALEPGTHVLEYVYFEATGGAAAEVFLSTSGGSEALTITSGQGSIVTPNISINEIMADNDNDVLVDGDGDASDWIELYNGTTSPVNIGDWYITDDATTLTKWQFPANTIIPSGGYLIVWASDKALAPPVGELHTNFKLSSNGEYLGLVSSDGTTIIDEIAPSFPEQSNGVSWGRFDTEQFTGYFVKPTPGTLNVFGYDGLVSDTSFDIDRGFYAASFPLTITTATAGATIIYTTNGSEPTNKNGGNGIVYSGPITIDETTVIRARAVLEGHYPSNIDTQTYLFADDVVTQDAAHAHALGFPSSNVNGQVFEYDMNLAAAGNDSQRVKDALLAIPTISLVLEQKNFSSSTDGIYVNALSRGLERPASIELINEDGQGTGQFQENVGLRIRGGFSRSAGNPKHAFRIFFRKTYGVGKLKYPLFQDEGTNEFDGFDLRTSQNYSWAFQNDSNNTFLREVFGRDTQRDMGQPYTRSRYYHLYINGHYWGLYMSQERAEADFAASYFGGVDDDYDTLKSAGSSNGYQTETTDGNFDDWQLLWDIARNGGNGGPSNTNYFKAQGLAADGLTPSADPVLLDVDNLADYLLVAFYTGSFDAPLSTFVGASNNWFGLRNRTSGDTGFHFFFHDGEHSLGTDGDTGQNTRSTDRTGPWGASIGTINDFTRSNPQYIHEDLAKNAEYRLAFADRAHRALVTPGGALTQPAVEARINERAVTVENVIDAEAVRWGSPTLNKTTWLGAKAEVFDWIDRGSNQEPANGPGRTELLLSQLHAYSDGALYPALDAPVYAQNGNTTPIGSGNVPTNFQLRMINPDAQGSIYYTTDGSDPRLPGGAVNTASASTYSSALTLTATTQIRSRILNGATWSAMNDATFLVGSLADASNLVISKMYYNQPGSVEDEEYIEVMNISGSEIELTGLTFTSGLTFDFSTAADTTLNPGERAVVVANETAFNAAFAAQLPIHVLGAYVGGLSNSGERIALLDASGGTIRDFSYNDSAPWPVTPDGDGAALALIAPLSNPDHSIGTNWRASTTLNGGTPGSDDSVDYDDWKAANGVTSDTEDLDKDGISALLEYAFGGNPSIADSAYLPTAAIQTLTVNAVADSYLTISFRRNIGAESLIYTPEVSTDLVLWNGGPSNIVLEEDPVHNGDGTETIVYRSVNPVGSVSELFIHVKVSY